MRAVIRAEQITDAVAAHGEGPVWFPDGAGLSFVDMMAGDVLRLDPSGGIERWHVGSVAAALRPRASGGVIIAGEREFLVASQWGGPLTSLGPVFADETLRFNEGGCDPGGNFYCGTMAYAETPGRGTLYRLDTGHRVTAAVTDVSVSNGLAWTADGRRAYYADTPTQRIDVFDFDLERGLHNRRPFVTIDPADGSPDGLCVDAEDGVWAALWEGSAVRHYTADGALADVVRVPPSKVTACTFGGADLDQLYLTTSRQGEATPSDPSAGAVFRADVGTAGVAVRPYGG